MSKSNNGSGTGSGGTRVWTVVCAVATVVLGPAAVTASALDQANKAPMYHAYHVVKADQTQAYIPSEPSAGRRRAVA
ncbi:MAG: hypothetical protein HOZ81_14690 [Streptomyces sp.]|nr:hypothetical protein [Streptomyces sp.]NUT25095.1 hypothetical protein [Streptomyces sp.]